MSQYQDKFLVIGAGFSGLGMAAAMQRSGIPFDIVEANDDVGGNWYNGVYETVHIISSRKTTEYKDFPMPSDWPDFPSGAQMISYLRSYADHYNLKEKTLFNTKVSRVTKADDDRWRVTLSNGESRVYRGVVVCSGHHWDRRMPQYPGEFSGQMIHSKDFKSNSQLQGKRVLVIGGGNSACDVAVEAGRVGVSSSISLRRGYWFLPKTLLGKPMVEIFQPWMPIWFQRGLLRAAVRVTIGEYKDYGLPQPDHKLYEHHPTVNSELLYALRHGRVKPRPDIARFDGEFVEFIDGTREAFDLIVAATGFHMSVPFVDGDVFLYKDNVPQLIASCIPIHHKNIFFFGFSQPRYGAGPLISLGAESICTIIKTQPRLKHPIGSVMVALGQRPPKSLLQDPFRLMQQIKAGQFIIPKLPLLEPYLMRAKQTREANPT
jgi:hypothetical protein